MILLFLRFEVADIVIFQVNAHPVENAPKLVLLTFGIVIRDRHGQVAADIQGFIG